MKNSKKIIILLSIIVIFTIGYKIWEQQKKITLNEKAANTTELPIKEKESYDEFNYIRDLNKDGVKEEINIIFNHNENVNLESYIITIKSKDKKYTFKKDELYNVFPQVKFVDFDVNDKYIEFYIESDGPSGDPNSTIYRVHNGIEEICNVSGTIDSYDGVGKIYTSYSKTYDKYKVLLSYYDIDKRALVFNSKSNIVGKKLQYDNSLILFTDSADTNGMNKVNCSSIIYDNIGKEELQKILDRYNKETIVKVCEPNEVLTIVDIDNTYHGNFKDGNPRNIRIKVKTSDNKEGWLDWLNGGD